MIKALNSDTGELLGFPDEMSADEISSVVKAEKYGSIEEYKPSWYDRTIAPALKASGIDLASPGFIAAKKSAFQIGESVAEGATTDFELDLAKTMGRGMEKIPLMIGTGITAPEIKGKILDAWNSSFVNPLDEKKKAGIAALQDLPEPEKSANMFARQIGSMIPGLALDTVTGGATESALLAGGAPKWLESALPFIPKFAIGSGLRKFAETAFGDHPYEAPLAALESMSEGMVYGKAGEGALAFPKMAITGAGQATYEALKQGRLPSSGELLEGTANGVAFAAAFHIIGMAGEAFQDHGDSKILKKANTRMEEAMNNGDLKGMHKEVTGLLQNDDLSHNAKIAIVNSFQMSKREYLDNYPKDMQLGLSLSALAHLLEPVHPSLDNQPARAGIINGMTEILTDHIMAANPRVDENVARQAATEWAKNNADEVIQSLNEKPESENTENIYEDVKRQLIDAGMSAEVAHHDAILAKAMAEQSAKVQGISPVEWYQKNINGIVKGTTPAKGALNQPVLELEAAKADIFYSKLERSIEAKMPKAASAQQIMGIVEGSGVKQEELEWSGLKEFLGRKESVSRQDVLDFLKSNQVQIEEVKKESTIKYKVNGEEKTTQDEGATKFSDYTLPGGENYREVLLTLPVKKDLPEGFELQERPNNGINSRWIVNGPGSLATNQYGSGPTREAALESFIKHGHTGSFKSSHFEEQNIIAHLRLNDRTDSEGKKVLFIEEIQSDWHQQGRKKGYSQKIDSSKWTAKQDADGHWHVYNEEGADIGNSTKWKSAAEAIESRAAESLRYAGNLIPDAPFKKTWHELALKRILRMAAEEGYEKIAWTTGEQQAERYDLSKRISKITYFKSTGALHVYGKDGQQLPVINGRSFAPDQLSDVIGKEVAQKITSTPESQNRVDLEGLDLKVGGEGMNGFYDQIIPSFLNKYTKKWGGRVGESKIPQEDSDSHYKGPEYTVEQLKEARAVTNGTGNEKISPLTGKPLESGFVVSRVAIDNPLRKMISGMESGMSFNEAFNDHKSSEMADFFGGELVLEKTDYLEKVHSLEITEAMRESALKDGQPLFQSKERPRGWVEFTPDEKAKIFLTAQADASTFVHELGHVWMHDFQRFIESGTASDRALKDWEILKDWLEIHGNQQKLSVEQQEKFARGFERYLRDGRAPSPELAATFQQFKKWLTEIYKTVRQLNVPMNNDVRNVMDRMLADVENPLNRVAENSEMTKNLADRFTKTVMGVEEKAAKEKPAAAKAPKQREPKTWLAKVRKDGGLDPESVKAVGYDLNLDFKQFGLKSVLKKGGVKLDSYAAELVTLGELRPKVDELPSAAFIRTLQEHGRDILEHLQERAKDYDAEYRKWYDEQIANGATEADIRAAEAELTPDLEKEIEAELSEEQARNVDFPFGDNVLEQSPAQAARAALKPAVQKLASMKDELVHLLAPKLGVDSEALDKIYEMKGGRDRVEFELERQMKSIEDAFDKMPRDEQVAFVDHVKLGEKQDTPELQAVADMMRKIEDAYFSEVQKVKPNSQYLQNHFRVFWKDAGQADKGFTTLYKRPLQGSKGFLKRHVFEDMSEGLDAGLEPVSYNPMTMWRNHIMDMQKFITANRMFQAMKDMDLVKFVKFGGKAPDDFVKLDDSISKVYFPVDAGLVNAGEFYIESNVGRILNNFLSKDYIRSSAWGSGLLAFKNLTTAVELSLSPFHAAYESGAAVSTKIGLGLQKIANRGDLFGGLKDILLSGTAPAEYALTGGDAIRYVTNPKDFLASTRGQDFLKQFPAADDLIKDAFNSGLKFAMHQDYKINSVKAFQEGIKEGEPWAVTFHAIPAANEMIMKPLFEIFIPRLKLGAFLKEYSEALVSHRDILASGEMTRGELGRSVADSIENRFGEMNFDNLFWNRTFKSALQLAVRSVTWKLGALKNVGVGIPEQLMEIKNAAATKRLPKLKSNFAYLMGVATLVTSMSSVIQKVAINKWPEKLKDILAPRYNAEGDRIMLNTHIKDWVHFKHSPVGFLTTSLSGEIGKLYELWNNKNFYGTEIVHEDDPAAKQAWDAFKQMVPMPFSFSSFQRLNETDAPLPIKLTSAAGFTQPAPKYISNTEAQNLASEIAGSHQSEGPKTQKDFDRQSLKHQLMMAYQNSGDSDPIYKTVDEGKISDKEADEIIQNAELPAIVRTTKHFSAVEMMRVLEHANAEEWDLLQPILEEKYQKKMDNENMTESDRAELEATYEAFNKRHENKF